MITVLGTTGHTGHRIAELLLSRGEKVRAVVRNKEKAKDLAAKGAEILAGNIEDAKFLAGAFRGSDAIYTLIPPNPAAPDFGAYQDTLGVATAQAIKESGVKKVVFLSSIGGDKSAGTGPIGGLHRQEKRLGELGVDLLVLRPTYFMENVGANLAMIKGQGINGGAIKPDLKFALVASSDIAEFAAKALATRDWKGVEVREILGPRDYTMAEITSILGAKIGRSDLKYVPFPYADFAKALTGFGLSPSVADGYAEMAKAFNEGTIKSVEGRTARNTTTTTFESFSESLAKSYAAL